MLHTNTFESCGLSYFRNYITFYLPLTWKVIERLKQQKINMYIGINLLKTNLFIISIDRSKINN